MKIFRLFLCVAVLVTILAGTGSSLAGAQDDRVVLTSKPFTESYLLTEIMVQLLQHDTDLTIVNRVIEGGTVSILHPAIVQGEIDCYPEYTGTGWQEVLKHRDIPSDPQELFERVSEEYLEQFNLVWLPSFGFNNTFTLAMREEDTESYALKSYSDLALVSSNFVFGSEPDFFEREDGFDRLVEVYGFNFKQTNQMAIALKYPAIKSGDVDVINAFSTDGLLKSFNLVILEDDLNFFPSYLAAPVIRQEILERHPEVGKSLSKLAGLISEEAMIDLNYQVEELRKDPREVARVFLEAQGLI